MPTGNIESAMPMRRIASIKDAQLLSATINLMSSLGSTSAVGLPFSSFLYFQITNSTTHLTTPDLTFVYFSGSMIDVWNVISSDYELRNSPKEMVQFAVFEWSWLKWNGVQVQEIIFRLFPIMSVNTTYNLSILICFHNSHLTKKCLKFMNIF